MGYYTNWNIRVLPEEREDEILDRIQTISGYEIWKGQISEAKWYDVFNHLHRLTENDTSFALIIDADGEESGDIYRIYAWNGQVQDVKPEIKYTDPDWWENVQEEMDKAKLTKIREEEKRERDLLNQLIDKYGLPKEYEQ